MITPAAPAVTLVPVDAANWRAVAALTVSEPQRQWVADPAYYLALCHYGTAGWQPLAVTGPDGTVLGFLMWTVDPADGAAWLGGIIIDTAHQGRGLGKAAVRAALDLLSAHHGQTSFALSYEPANTAARHCYTAVGFTETGETEDTELVARLNLPG
ncbi:GNAT family N-acetyltransferase [Catellatospora bangladeshensis]|uniref:Spermidine acetyltransferase n=1 Tax=Catellatospora bangladeshensis TaxID=310355 RepID=A0A8J3J992_9ACTN|nr:GNAT family N-acetyltransferase [Catellatospora bangladeshensis]GIF80657.1 spermidine acetyltransferase [Catellatospora bangladeshensis]